MAGFGASDIAGMIAGCGGVPVRVTVSGEVHETLGLKDVADEDLLRDVEHAAHLTGKVIVVVVKTGSLPTLAQGTAIEVEDTALRIISAHQIDDGELTRLLCARTS